MSRVRAWIARRREEAERRHDREARLRILAHFPRDEEERRALDLALLRCRPAGWYEKPPCFRRVRGGLRGP